MQTAYWHLPIVCRGGISVTAPQSVTTPASAPHLHSLPEGPQEGALRLHEHHFHPNELPEMRTRVGGSYIELLRHMGYSGPGQ